MFVRHCHLLVFAFLTCLLCCKAKDAPVLVTLPTNSPNADGGVVSTTKSILDVPPTKSNAAVDATAIPKVDVQPSQLSPASQTAPTKSKSNTEPVAISSSTKSSVEDVTVPSPSTIKPDPDPTSTSSPTTPTTSTTPVTTPTTSKPSTTTPTPAPPAPPAPPSPTPPTTTPTPAPTSAPTTPSTPKPTTTPKQNVTTAAPSPAPHHNRQFDGPSFIGGIVLATGLMAIGFVAFKFYKARTERNYHTL